MNICSVLLGVLKSGSSLGEARGWVSYGDTGMKSHQLFICDMRLNVLLKTSFHILECEDFGGCHVEGQLFAVQVQQEKLPGTAACATQGQSPGTAPGRPTIPRVF